MIIDSNIVLKHLLFIVCSFIFMYEIRKCIEKLMKNPTTTIIYFDEFGKHGVPNITVCAYANHWGNETSYKTDKLAEHGLTMNRYVRGTFGGQTHLTYLKNSFMKTLLGHLMIL